MSSLKALIKQHTERFRTLIEPIRLTFGDVEEGDKAKTGGGSSSSRLQRMPTNLKIYDGSTNLDDHITRFVGVANQGEWHMPMWCRMFQQMLDGPARGWFDWLPNGCVDNWTDLRENFVERFALWNKCCKDPTEVSKIIRRANETLPDFKECWTEEINYIQDVPEVMQISTFMSNSKCPKLARLFSDQVPRTVTEMMNRVDDFVKSKEAFKSTKLPRGEFPDNRQGTSYQGSRPPRATYGGGQQRTYNYNNFNRRDHYQPYVLPRTNNQRYDNRRQEVNHPSLDALTKRPKEILATELQLQLPSCPPMIGTSKK
ncbi:hypothetical protein Tco_0748141 [Tanacetum coccineum]|uniref:Retrotransposon gag domain-containing protein n=1 Tax=Tanacetum coccineum TaxID=301880 RepID=A0ABQ4YUZ5_9ASTR